MGELVPVGCMEVLPGDTFQHNASTLLRVSPLVAPVMHPVNVRIHHFFVPNRLIWANWEDFITGGPDGNNADTVPQITITANASILDYMGVPLVVGRQVNALPVYAYNLIYNQYFRDQDLVTEVAPTNVQVRKIAWEKDYLTEARPWEQKGDSVSIPLTGGQAPVTGIGPTAQTVASTNIYETGGTAARTVDAIGAANLHAEQDASNTGFPGIYANLDQIDALDVPDMRLGLALQRYKEARAMYGSRYVEYLRYLGVNNGDARLDRAEYLGGGRQNISFSEVLQTAEGVDPVGDMKGHGIAALRSNRYRKYFGEHGYVISLMSVRPKAMYVDSLHRKWSRTDKEDFYQRELELVGQQEVLNKEVRLAHATPDGIFGYADRYREYREEPSTVSAEFRSLLNYWHMGRIFASDPALNQSFVECDPTARIHADQTNDKLWCMVNHSCVARRMVRPKSMPRII